MSVFKLYDGKRITSKHPKYAQARWWCYKRIAGHRTIHQSIPEARTKEQAEQAERQLVDAVFRRAYGLPDNVTTFAGFIEKVYKHYVEQHNVNTGAKDLYVRLLKDHFGTQVMTTITPQDCRNCREQLRRRKKKNEQPLASGSVNRIMSTASKIFSLACEEGILDRNPMEYVKALPEPPARRRLLTPEQKAALWDALEKDELMKRLVILAVNLPLRRGQLMALTPESCNFESGLLCVIASKRREPRVVPINSIAEATLKAMIADSQLPFPLKDFRKRWHRALVAAGINDKDNGSRESNFHFHDLRTEFASELIRRNVNPAIVQKLFAHSSMEITNIYVDADSETMLDAVKTLENDIQQSEVVQ